MIYLGSNRIVTNDFNNHQTAEDYAGNHLSDISIVGSGKVIKIINSFKSHEDSINYDDYLRNREYWKDGNNYNCISITGKTVRMHYNELGGNQVYIEALYNNEKIVMRFCHLDSVLVQVGDIVKSNQVFARQGNTGLVLSSKDRSNPTYGSHVHLEIVDKNGNYLNPRPFAQGQIVTTYIEQTNIVDNNKKQIQILVDKINIREKPDELSTDLGDVYFDEVYTILEEIDSLNYIWYKITTNLGLTGYVASKKGENWIKILDVNKDIADNIVIGNTNDSEYEFLFKCPKEDYYYLKLYENESLYIKKSS